MKFKSNFFGVFTSTDGYTLGGIVLFAVVCERNSVAVVAEVAEGCDDGLVSEKKALIVPLN